MRFAVVGAAGFVVDTSALYAAMYLFGTGPYIGRAFSYLSAATFTWALNRRFTFVTHKNGNAVHEWMKFLAANLAGGIVNYAVYAVLIASSTFVATWPVLGVAMGSISGLVVNFLLSKRFVFAHRQ